MGLIFILYQGVFSPYRICFGDNAYGGMAVFEIIQDFFFLGDIIVSFNTGIYQEGQLVMLRTPITISYAKFWLWIDLFSSFPYSMALSVEDYFDIRFKAEVDNNVLFKINKGIR